MPPDAAATPRLLRQRGGAQGSCACKLRKGTWQYWGTPQEAPVSFRDLAPECTPLSASATSPCVFCTAMLWSWTSRLTCICLAIASGCISVMSCPLTSSQMRTPYDLHHVPFYSVPQHNSAGKAFGKQIRVVASDMALLWFQDKVTYHMSAFTLARSCRITCARTRGLEQLQLYCIVSNTCQFSLRCFCNALMHCSSRPRLQNRL